MFLKNTLHYLEYLMAHGDGVLTAVTEAADNCVPLLLYSLELAQCYHLRSTNQNQSCTCVHWKALFVSFMSV